MATSLAEIRAKLQAQETRSQGGQSQGDNAIYAHWNIPEGSSSKIRFLPDANAKNDFFWVERLMIRLPFAGIKGQSDSKPVVVQVPCVEMYGDACPILAEVRTWFKDPGLEEMGRKYWKKKSYLFQGFVRENPLADDKTPENPIRRFVISPQIFNLIKAALMDPELESMPTDYTAGLDFTVTKTSKGGYADYSTSKWSRKETALTAQEQAAIDSHGLYNLSDFLPKRPGEVELKVIKEMFEASVDGQAYDPDRWSQYFKPSGFQSKGGNDDVETSTPAPAAAQGYVAPNSGAVAAQPAPFEADEDDAPVATAPVATPAAKPSSQKAEDILAMIRNRSKQ
jgi:hypothetical protein